MKEKLVEILKLISYYPRKIIDFFLFHFYLKQRNDWNILKFFSHSILACNVYLPSTNSKFLFFKITAKPADPEKLEISLNLFG